jgi:broad specificity phosphatase PhoE
MKPMDHLAELWLVRHGETVGGSSTRLYGSTDLALSDVGRRQMERVRDALAGVTFDRVNTSPLRRSREAASLVHPAPLPPHEVHAAFTEIDFGHWEGLTADEIAARHPLDHARWRTADGTAPTSPAPPQPPGDVDAWAPTSPAPPQPPGDAEAWGFPGGETRAGFRRRVAAAVAEQLADSDGRTLLVLHKGVVKVILGTLLGESAATYSVRPCELGSVHLVVRAAGGWRMPRPCMVDHLGDDRLVASR